MGVYHKHVGVLIGEVRRGIRFPRGVTDLVSYHVGTGNSMWGLGKSDKYS